MIREYTHIVETSVNSIFASYMFDTSFPMSRLEEILLKKDKDFADWKIESLTHSLKKTGGNVMKDDFIFEMLHNSLLKIFVL